MPALSWQLGETGTGHVLTCCHMSVGNYAVLPAWLIARLQLHT
jgi:hypothetical protein